MVQKHSKQSSSSNISTNYQQQQQPEQQNERIVKYIQNSKGNQMTSEKLKNEILPLLNGSDDDIDELDDEVAMISHKKDPKDRKDEISTSDIKITFKDDMSLNKQRKTQQQQQQQQQIQEKTYQDRTNNVNQMNKQYQYQQQQQQNQAQQQQQQEQSNKKEDDPENTRNFNTLPRNYSDSNKNNQLNIEIGESFNSKMLIEDNLSKDSMNQLDLGVLDGCNSIQAIEQFIFERSNNKTNENWFGRLLAKSVKSIRVVGLNCNSIPAITNLTVLMNDCFYLKKEKQTNDALEIDFMVGILMISNKRQIQATEIFRRIQAQYIKQIENLQIELKIIQQRNNNQPSPRNNNVVNKNQKGNEGRDNKQGLNESEKEKKREINKLFQKCALLELLVVESMCTTQQVNDKLSSIKRIIDFFTGKLAPAHQFQQQIFFSEDPYTIMIKILPYLLKFVIICMTHKKEVVRLSAVKLLEFILETKGCSLDAAMVLILKAILKTYPGIQTQNQSSQKEKEAESREDSFNMSAISSNASEYLRSPRQGSNANPLFKNEQMLVNEKGTFNNTVNLKFKNLQQKSEGVSPSKQFTEYQQIKEPNSGFNQAMKNAYNHVLDTYISVLSSISSHILHQLFYEVIIQCLTGSQQNQNGQIQQQQSLNEIKIFSIKIAEKIITICQGDLLLNKYSLDSLLQQVTVKLGNNSSENNLQGALKNLWQNIRTKVFANYSLKGMKGLIEWLVEKMTLLAHTGQRNSPAISSGIGSGAFGESSKSNSQPIPSSELNKLEITEEESYQLQQLLDIISLISIGKKKNEEEANNLIKIKQDYCVDLYLLINPLLFWLDFSVEREERLNLFKAIYSTIKDVLENLPPKKVDLDILQIMIPILQRTTEYLKNNSPSLSMLKFLDLVLRDIKGAGFCQRNPDLQYFFLEMLNNFVPYISYSLYEEVFSVFDKLLQMCSDVINEKVVHKCIVALVDKYTIKSKSHKNSVTVFMKSLLEVKVTDYRQQKSKHHNNNNNLELDEGDLDEDQISIHSKNNYFEIMTDFCFFNNEDPSSLSTSLPSSANINIDYVSQQQRVTTELLKKYKNPIDHHEMYIDKLQFFIDALGQLNEMHINIFTALIMQPRFKQTLLALLNKGETQLRLKCHEILDIITNYYVQYCTSKTVYELAIPQMGPDNGKRKNNTQNEQMEVEFINHERLYVSQMVINCVRLSLEQKNDSYLQFNSLILLDFLFQNLLPVPTYQNEYLKGKGVNIGGTSNRSKSNQNQSSDKFGKSMMDNLIDLESLEINEQTPEFEVTDERYLFMRLNLVFKLWPHIQQALNSAWSNIRSICYGLICSMLKIDLRDFSPPSLYTSSEKTQKEQQQNNNNNNVILVKLKQLILPMLLNLLSSKESESKAGGLNILGSFCGLSYDFSKVKISKNLEFFKKNSNFVSLGIWQLVFDLQDDWDITIKEASVVLIQLCAPRDAVKYFDRVKREKENLKFSNILNRYAITPGAGIGGGQSSQSSRNQLYLNSGTSNEEDFQQIAQPLSNFDPTKQNIMSFLSGTDDINMLLQMEQSNNFGTSHPNELDLHTPLSQNQFIQSLKLQNQLRNMQKGEDSIKEEQILKKNMLDLDMQSVINSEHPPISHNFQEQLIANAGGSRVGDLDLLAEIDNSIDTFHFFVDEYNDEQIQEIISIFRNDFKPPKNLWIEKNPSSAFNPPDYYAEIYSQAIEQFNQQQMQLQQQQQQEMQMKVSNSPKASSSGGGSSNISIKSGLMNAVNGNNSNQGGGVMNTNNMIVDALEDDLVKRYENEKKEKDKGSGNSGNQQEGNSKENYLIFERHFEDSKDGKEDPNREAMNIQVNKGDDLGSIDAEPYKFLGGDSPSDQDEFFPGQVQQQKPTTQSTSQQKSNQEEMKQGQQQKGTTVVTGPPQQQLKLQILEENDMKMYQQEQQQQQKTSSQQREISSQFGVNKDEKLQKGQSDSKNTDELIEEYERKINKTIQLLEEEKKKNTNNKNSGKEEEISKLEKEQQQYLIAGTIESNAKSTPEFKSKKEKGNSISVNMGQQQDNNNFANIGMKDINLNSGVVGKNKKAGSQSSTSTQQQQQQSAAVYLSELSRGYINNADNIKLIKQINNVFNDTSTLNFQSNSTTAGVQKHKQKLNKSFENIMAAQKQNLKGSSQDHLNKSSKKNLSSSPRRGSSSGKKVGMSSKLSGSGHNKKKYISDSNRVMQSSSNNNAGKAFYNMRDLNFFIKTIEKDLSEKFNKMTLKDFNSMPTTPTSILKKVEDQVKAQALNKDQKAYMSNTCPNIAQVLGSLDTSQSSKSNQVLQISNIQNLSQGACVSSKSNNSEIIMTSNHTPSSFSNNPNIFGNNNQQMQQQHYQANMQNNKQQQQAQNMDKFSFSKTQKIDLNSINKNIFGYGSGQGHSSNIPQNYQKEENTTQRDGSNENFGKSFKISPKIEEKQLYTNLLKSSKNAKSGGSQKHSKRSRGSQDKYSLGYGGGGGNAMAFLGSGQSQTSGQSSQSKLNKSANIITNSQQSQIAAKIVKKQQLSKSFIDATQMMQNQQQVSGGGSQQQQHQQILQNNMSPTAIKKQITPVSHQPSKLTTAMMPSQIGTLQQTPTGNMNVYNTQYSHTSSNLMYDYIQNSDQMSKKMGGGGISHMSHIGTYTSNLPTNNKTPIKQSGIKNSLGMGTNGGTYQYSEILDMSPSSGEKDLKLNTRSIF